MKKVKCICWCGRGGCGADITGDTCCVFHVAYSGGGSWNDDGVWSIPVVDCLKYEMGLGRRLVSVCIPYMTTHVFEDGRGTRPGPCPGKEIKNEGDTVVGVVVVMEVAEVEVVCMDLCRCFC